MTSTAAPILKYPQRQLGKNGPFVSAIGFGTMGIGTPWYGRTPTESDAFTALSCAADRGVTFWDCADSYGQSEKILSRWFAQTGRRADIFLATKFGYTNLAAPSTLTSSRPTPAPDSTPAYIRTALARSLEQLGTEYIDLYYQHRVDPTVPIEVVLETLRPFVDAGTIRWLGLSECSAATLCRAKAVPGIGAKIIAAQMEYSPFTLDIERSGFAQAAEELGVAVVAYSPLARGMVAGAQRTLADFSPADARLRLPRYSPANFPKNLVLVDALAAVGAKQGCSPAQVALAWILAEHPGWVPIPASSTPARILENARSAEIVLSDEAVKEIRKLADDAEVAGARMYGEGSEVVEGNCVEVGEWKGEEEDA
ncbi:Aldo/keto reductase [Athelia psychrophila]|uniref:Aldo/keto reductase n=1 Tax=Athelia psychrophila TaxID=1759441 RepID=A0A167WSP4_9AGAM|nr:Aldo/keto reductase [Fibularhizoctonia sp. CBS 109695]